MKYFLPDLIRKTLGRVLNIWRELNAPLRGIILFCLGLALNGMLIAFRLQNSGDFPYHWELSILSILIYCIAIAISVRVHLYKRYWQAVDKVKGISNEINGLLANEVLKSMRDDHIRQAYDAKVVESTNHIFYERQDRLDALKKELPRIEAQLRSREKEIEAWRAQGLAEIRQSLDRGQGLKNE